MIKNVMKRVWAFDIEWIPDPVAGRILYDLPEDTTAVDIMKVMWEKGGATEEDPTPFLKTAICRVVSVAALERRQQPDGSVKLNLMALPHDPTSNYDAEFNKKEHLETYIKNLEEQLNSVGDDAQLANVDLQNMLQKQQQTLQMMSNISKMLHDTAMAIIRKIGG